jgi:hypothetical protein
MVGPANRRRGGEEEALRLHHHAHHQLQPAHRVRHRRRDRRDDRPGRRDRPSKYSTSFVFTTNSQISIPLRVDLTLPSGEWTAILMWRLSRWPAPTWGLGEQTPDSARAIINRINFAESF